MCIYLGWEPARKFFIQLASAMSQGTRRKQAQGASKHKAQVANKQADKAQAGTSKQVLGWAPPTGF